MLSKLKKLQPTEGNTKDPVDTATTAEAIAAVNLAAPSAKLTMAQLFTAAGSIVAIIAGARNYSSLCGLNLVLWENTTGTSSTLFERDDSNLEVLLLKPNRNVLTTWSNIFRATMSNLTLVTIGIAVKNFIIRTAMAKSAVKTLVDAVKDHKRRDIQDKKRDADVVKVLQEAALSFGRSTIMFVGAQARNVYQKLFRISPKVSTPSAKQRSDGDADEDEDEVTKLERIIEIWDWDKHTGFLIKDAVRDRTRGRSCEFIRSPRLPSTLFCFGTRSS